MKGYMRLCVSLLFLIQCSIASAAVLSTDYGKITWIENGWFGEGMAFNMTVPAGNSTCAGSKTEFALAYDHPSYKELVSVLLMAYSSDAKVRVIYDPASCSFGNRTRVTAINVSK